MYSKLKNKNFFKLYFFVSLSIVFFTICFCYVFLHNNLTWQDYLSINAIENLSYESGSGTVDDPYIIATPTQLATIASVCNNGNNFENTYFKLKNNISLSGYSWIPIGGTDRYTANPFSGNFDGCGYTIFNINVNVSNRSAGLFGYIRNSNISNLVLASGQITGDINAGGIAGKASNSTIENCANLSVNIFSKKNSGGIIGEDNSTSFNACKNSSTIITNNSGFTSTGTAGGICGYSSLSTFSLCYNSGNVGSGSNTSNYVGGISGYYGTVTKSYNSGTIVSGSTNSLGSSVNYAGGIVGYNGLVSSSGNSGSITARALTKTSESTINDSIIKAFEVYKTNYYIKIEKNWKEPNANVVTTTSSNAYAGGICGSAIGNVVDCYNIGSVSGGKKTVSGKLTFVYINNISEIGVNDNWFSTFEATKVEFSYTEKYYYSPICGQTYGSIENCYGNLNYDRNVDGLFSNYFDVKAPSNREPYYRFEYGNEWNTPTHFYNYGKYSTFFGTGNFGGSKETLQTNIDTRNGISISIKCRVGNTNDYVTFNLYSGTFNNEIIFINRSNEEIKNLVGNGLNSNVWYVDKNINYGYPFLKEMVW